MPNLLKIGKSDMGITVETNKAWITSELIIEFVFKLSCLM